MKKFEILINGKPYPGLSNIKISEAYNLKEKLKNYFNIYKTKIKILENSFDIIVEITTKDILIFLLKR